MNEQKTLKDLPVKKQIQYVIGELREVKKDLLVIERSLKTTKHSTNEEYDLIDCIINALTHIKKEVK